jgi:hypothetical protein
MMRLATRVTRSHDGVMPSEEGHVYGNPTGLFAANAMRLDRRTIACGREQSSDEHVLTCLLRACYHDSC